jgi:hypothetical protein
MIFSGWLDSSLESEIVRPRADVRPMASSTASAPGWDDGNHSENLYGGFSGGWAEEGQDIILEETKMRMIGLKARKSIYTPVQDPLAPRRFAVSARNGGTRVYVSRLKGWNHGPRHGDGWLSARPISAPALSSPSPMTPPPLASINLPPWTGNPIETAEVWTLRKGERVATCRLWSNPLGGEVRLEVDGLWCRGETHREALALLDVALEWQRKFGAKGWSGDGRV